MLARITGVLRSTAADSRGRVEGTGRPGSEVSQLNADPSQCIRDAVAITQPNVATVNVATVAAPISF